MCAARLNVLPNLRGVLIITSLEHFAQPLCCMIAGLRVAHSFLYSTRATHFSKEVWNCSWCADLRRSKGA